MKDLMPIERIENKIYLIRGQKVMLDRDLAVLYGIGTRDLNKAVARNLERFPEDFMFVLNKEEAANLKFHFGTSSLLSGKTNKIGWGGRRKLPRAFTEQGIAMLSSVLRSRRAVLANILIIRTFVKLRQMLSNHKKLAEEFKKLKQRVGKHDAEIAVIFDAIQKLMAPPEKPARRIGFIQGE